MRNAIYFILKWAKRIAYLRESTARERECGGPMNYEYDCRRFRFEKYGRHVCGSVHVVRTRYLYSVHIIGIRRQSIYTYTYTSTPLYNLTRNRRTYGLLLATAIAQ